jgi:hypothetical protein
MRYGVLCAAIAAALTTAWTGAVEARSVWRHRRHAHFYPRYELYPPYALPPSRRPCFSLDDCDRKAFDESGTRGRMGLGADPAHPEGPGNVSD